ncbi:MAG TPA: hypothetical protein VMH48_04925 [Methylomirabilota bacterium]|nr:hypothetical protein [Methylomirabilota bacterium]
MTIKELKMKKPFLLATAVIFGATLAQAGNKPEMGTIVSENSVACGSKLEKNKQSVELLCQEYVVRTATTDYHIRQLKPSDKSLIPINTSIEFTLDKDKMKFRANGKSYEYVVVSEAAAPKS